MGEKECVGWSHRVGKDPPLASAGVLVCDLLRAPDCNRGAASVAEMLEVGVTRQTVASAERLLGCALLGASLHFFKVAYEHVAAHCDRVAPPDCTPTALDAPSYSYEIHSVRADAPRPG